MYIVIIKQIVDRLIITNKMNMNQIYIMFNKALHQNGSTIYFQEYISKLLKQQRSQHYIKQFYIRQLLRDNVFYDSMNVQCTMYIVHSTLYTAQCTVYIVHCTMYSMKSTLYEYILFRCIQNVYHYNLLDNNCSNIIHQCLD